MAVMKFWQAEFASKKSIHPEGEKTVILFVKNDKKGAATEAAKDQIITDAFEGENGVHFKAPIMTEVTSEVYNDFSDNAEAEESFDDMDFDDFDDMDFDDVEASDESEEYSEEDEDQSVADDSAKTESFDVTDENQDSNIEPASIDDIPLLACAIRLFGRKVEYSDDEIDKIEKAVNGDVSEKEKSDIGRVIKISEKCVIPHIKDLTFADVSEVVAYVDSAGLKNKNDEGLMREAGCSVANRLSISNRGDKIKSIITEKADCVKLPHFELFKLPVPAPFELFIKVLAVGDKFKSSFLVGVEGVKSYGTLDAFEREDFSKLENAFSFSCGLAMNYFIEISEGEGHLSGAAKKVIDTVSRFVNAGDKLAENINAIGVSGGVKLVDFVEPESNRITKINNPELFDLFIDGCEFDCSDVPKHGKGYVNPEVKHEGKTYTYSLTVVWDYSWGIEDWGDGEWVAEEQEEKPVKESDIEDQLEIEEEQEDFVESDGFETQYTLDQINEIVNKLKSGETFGCPDLDENIYRRADGMSNSSLSMFIEDASSLEWVKNCPADEDKIKPLNLGRAVHCALLEPEMYESLYVTAPSLGNSPQQAQIDKYNEWVKAGRIEDKKLMPTDMTIEKMDKTVAFENEVSKKGLTVLSREDKKKLDLMVGSMNSHPTVKQIMSNIVYAEYSIWWISPESGVLCKCRVDGVAEVGGKYWPLDIKTTGSFADFGKSVCEFGYDRQEAHYVEGFSQHFENTLNKMLFLVVSSSIMIGRYKSGVFETPIAWVDDARQTIDAALLDYKSRCESGDFVSIKEVSYKWRNK